MDKREATRQLLKGLFGVRVFESNAESWAAGENEPLGYPYATWDENYNAYWLVTGKTESAYFKPCDDISDAWQIVDRMREAGYELTLETWANGEVWTKFQRSSREPMDYTIAHPAANSIVIAALKALGIPIEGGE